jgi:hypothetical protein
MVKLRARCRKEQKWAQNGVLPFQFGSGTTRCRFNSGRSYIIPKRDVPRLCTSSGCLKVPDPSRSARSGFRGLRYRAIRAMGVRSGALVPGQNGCHKGARPWSGQSRSRHLASRRLGATHGPVTACPQKRQQLSHGRKDGAHQQRQSSQPDEPGCRKRQRELDRVHHLPPQPSCSTPEATQCERAASRRPRAEDPDATDAAPSPRVDEPRPSCVFLYRKDREQAVEAGVKSRVVGTGRRVDGGPGRWSGIGERANVEGRESVTLWRGFR